MSSMPAQSPTPWNSIAEGMVDWPSRQLPLEQALESPCASCATSPCCTHLPLHTFQVRTLLELDHARYLLNFDRIELGVSSGGEWSVYYRYPCRFLDRDTFGCRLHATPEQPRICVHYNPYQCWYKRVLTRPVTDDFVRIDRPRFEALLPLYGFDDTGAIVAAPDWATLVATIAGLPLAPQPPVAEPPPSPDPVSRAWKELVVNPAPSNGAARAYRFGELVDPCQGCAAYCCTTLVFPQAYPTSVASLDYLKFCLGFPGIEVGITDEGWSIIVKTACRHLVSQRCAVYGQPERPLLCTYYDANKCTYRIHFGQPRPAGHVRLSLEQFPLLTECFRFDAHGTVIEALSTDGIRAHVEANWLAETAAEPAAEPTSAVGTRGD